MGCGHSRDKRMFVPCPVPEPPQGRFLEQVHQSTSRCLDRPQRRIGWIVCIGGKWLAMVLGSWCLGEPVAHVRRESLLSVVQRCVCL